MLQQLYDLMNDHGQSSNKGTIFINALLRCTPIEHENVPDVMNN